MFFFLRPSPVPKPMTGEEARDSDEESDYMVPSSRPVLPPIAAPPPVVDAPAVPRHPQATLQIQTQASTLNSRYFEKSLNSLPAANVRGNDCGDVLRL